AGSPIMVLDRVVMGLDGRPIECRMAYCHLVDKYYMAEMVSRRPGGGKGNVGLCNPGRAGAACPSRGEDMPVPRASAALTRFTVLDLTRVRAGPTAVRQLADWGANVIKVELPEHQEPADAMGGPRHGPDFQNLHRNKRSITLDLKSADGAAVFRRLAAKADVIVENFRPDVKTRLGIDYAALAKLNPRLVYASISGFGQDGPYAKRPGFDQIAQGLGGLMSITG